MSSKRERGGGLRSQRAWERAEFRPRPRLHPDPLASSPVGLSSPVEPHPRHGPDIGRCGRSGPPTTGRGSPACGARRRPFHQRSSFGRARCEVRESGRRGRRCRSPARGTGPAGSEIAIRLCCAAGGQRGLSSLHSKRDRVRRGRVGRSSSVRSCGCGAPGGVGGGGGAGGDGGGGALSLPTGLAVGRRASLVLWNVNGSTSGLCRSVTSGPLLPPSLGHIVGTR